MYSNTIRNHRKENEPDGFQHDHPTLTYLSQFLQMKSSPPRPPAGPVVQAALSLPDDLARLFFQKCEMPFVKQKTYNTIKRYEALRKQEEAELRKAEEEEEAKRAAERRAVGARRRANLIWATRNRNAWLLKRVTAEDVIALCWRVFDKLVAQEGDDVFRKQPYESREMYVERMRTYQHMISAPWKEYREKLKQEVDQWWARRCVELREGEGEEDIDEDQLPYRERLMKVARDWDENRLRYHHSGLPVFLSQLRPPRVLARAQVDRKFGRCLQCESAGDAICTLREGITRKCGRCKRLGADCLVPSTKTTYAHHGWHYGAAVRGNTDPLPRYADNPGLVNYLVPPAKDDVEAWAKLRAFLDDVKAGAERLRREKTEREERVEFVGGETGFVVVNRRENSWALPMRGTKIVKGRRAVPTTKASKSHSDSKKKPLKTRSKSRKDEEVKKETKKRIESIDTRTDVKNAETRNEKAMDEKDMNEKAMYEKAKNKDVGNQDVNV